MVEYSIWVWGNLTIFCLALRPTIILIQHSILFENRKAVGHNPATCMITRSLYRIFTLSCVSRESYNSHNHEASLLSSQGGLACTCDCPWRHFAVSSCILISWLLSLPCRHRNICEHGFLSPQNSSRQNHIDWGISMLIEILLPYL